ncbi:MAG TPA: response regulator [Fimbriimonadaceae bacterium]|nr:response regulator [Armatimonadota bacterium]HCM72985.1 response regulator [Armatimonadota bacterium]HRD31661.1 response regulator [Fimbriimonadaceae bacterium]HRE92978.1 response regulator [Fimbriimonadaceae bacterium]HRI74499.1 response regulator [Fimbriimonadaceae bacterium]
MTPLRVIIADDDPIIRLDVKQMLHKLGFEVVAEAEDGAVAVDLARRLEPDVVVLDVKMPVKDGIDAAREITDEGIAPTVLLTAYSDQELIVRAQEAGVYGYLVKPFNPSHLAPAIQVARSRFETNRQLNQEVADLRDRIETRKLVERAKGALMADRGLSEDEAYRRIQQQSMNARKSMREVAEAILLARGVSD